MILTKTLTLAIAWFTVAATALVTAQLRYLPNAPGTWKPWVFRAYPDNQRLLGAKPAEVKAFDAQLIALGAIVKKTPGFAEPIGFSVETAGDMELLSFRPPSGAPKLAATAVPLAGTFNFGAYGVYESDRGGKAVRGDTGETSQLLFFVNQLAALVYHDQANFVPEFENLETDVTRLAGSQPDFLGMPRYGDMLVLKKNPAPLWTAVPIAEALELAARGIDLRLAKNRENAARLQAQYDDLKSPAKREKRIAEYKALAPMVKDPGYMDKMMKVEDAMAANAGTLLGPIGDAQKQVAAAERELIAARSAAAALAPAERAAPACYASSEPVSLSRFQRTPSGRCVPLVRPNWKLFNPALPRSAPQLLAIAHFAPCFVDGQKFIHAGGCLANKRLLETIDRQALLAWLQ